ncbi:MAG: peptide chain release factor 2 [Actinobacteria bacterium]|nr:peptide chain release factor 2 [Actinomycetota bacterium]
MPDNHADALAELRRRVDHIREYLDIDRKRARLEELQDQAAAPGLWDDPDAARVVTTELSRVEAELTRYDAMQAKLDDLEVLNELAQEEADRSTAAEVERSLDSVGREVDRLEVTALLSGEYDSNDAIVSIKAGEGGVDAMDWAQMLQRMYLRWADNNGYETEVFDESFGEEAGLKSTAFEVRGPDAYGMLSTEHGVHRLLRNSPFDSQGRRQTSFALVDVVPVLPEADEEIEVPDEDIRVDVYRSSGPGGQSVNTTDSAVRITHLPTNIVVSCQNEKSQHQNRAAAMRVLKVRLAEVERQKRDEELAAVRGDRQNVGFGSQIRSFFMYGNQIVKDHRTNHEHGNPATVLDGGEALDEFIGAELRRRATASAATG